MTLEWNRAIRNAGEIENLNAKIAPMLDRLETQLSQTTWLCGNRYSLADTVWTTVLNRLDELKFNYLWVDQARPALNSYLNHLRFRPSFKAAIQRDKMPLPMLLAGLRRVFLGI